MDLKSLLRGPAVRFARETEQLPRLRLELQEPTRALLVFEPPGGAKLGDHWDVKILMAHRDARIAGGSTYQCRVVLPPDTEREIKLDIEMIREIGSATTRFIVRPTIIDKDAAASGIKDLRLHAVPFSAVGLKSPIELLRWHGEQKAFIWDVHLASDDIAVRRITFVAQSERLEGRTTINVAANPRARPSRRL